MSVFDGKTRRAIWDATKTEIFTTRLFFDPLALPLTVLLSKVPWITPNHVTFAALLPGLAGAWFFARGDFLIGMAGYYLFFLLDSMDGKLARLTSRLHPLGGFCDFVVDRVVICAMVAGMCLSFFRAGLAAEFIMAQAYILLLLLKDVVDCKWKESGVGESAVPRAPPGPPRLFERLKVHFKPGQLLSCFLAFVVGPLTQAYLWTFGVAILCVLFSIAHNTGMPLWRYRRTRL